MPRILIVDDEEANRLALERIGSREGWEVSLAASAQQALQLLREQEVGVLITDLKMPGMDGMALLRLCRQLAPDTQVIVVTAYGTVERAVEAMKEGAADFVTKPLRRADVVAGVTRALERYRLLSENHRLREQLAKGPSDEVVGQSPALLGLLEEARQVAPSLATVMITGESGTGKGLLARWLHRHSNRAAQRLVTINCGAIPENLLESELFGYESGAFTGATAKKEGRFDLAAGGTLFLDEVTEMSPALQVKLLRVLQDGEYERVGGTRTLQTDVRIIAGTNRDPEQAMAEGRLRMDLFYRLNVIRLHVPPLRERREDILLLVRHLLVRHSKRNNKEIHGITPEALSMLERYHWPGNVRELENAVERAVVLCRSDVLGPLDLPASVRAAAGSEDNLSFAVGTPLRDVERRMIEATLKACGGDRSRAASLLGIAPRTIQRREAEWRGEILED